MFVKLVKLLGFYLTLSLAFGVEYTLFRSGTLVLYRLIFEILGSIL